MRARGFFDWREDVLGVLSEEEEGIKGDLDGDSRGAVDKGEGGAGSEGHSHASGGRQRSDCRV